MPQKATSTKPPPVKAGVIAQYTEGKSRAAIARDLKIDRQTVTRILGEPGVAEAIESSRERCIGLLPKAERAFEAALDAGDGQLALRFLEKSGVLVGAAEHQRPVDPRIQVAIKLLGPAPTAPQTEAAHRWQPRPNLWSLLKLTVRPMSSPRSRTEQALWDQVYLLCLRLRCSTTQRMACLALGSVTCGEYGFH